MLVQQLKCFGPVVASLLLVGPAFADAIDGNWCHSDGRRLSIRGPEIVTPAGKAMEGNYSRHWFSYVVPPPEPGTGHTVHLRLGEGSSTPETWVRCTPSISARENLPPA